MAFQPTHRVLPRGVDTEEAKSKDGLAMATVKPSLLGPEVAGVDTVAEAGPGPTSLSVLSSLS